jgi:c-di-GMP-binding flagellar brake protein YcgR
VGHRDKVNEVASRVDTPEPPERRKSERFPIHLDLQYRAVNRIADTSEGVGRILDISSGGVLFSAQEQIGNGLPLEVSVCWPARLDGNCPLKLVAVGRVVRSEGCRTALRFERYEFRTRRLRVV